MYEVNVRESALLLTSREVVQPPAVSTHLHSSIHVYEYTYDRAVYVLFVLSTR